MDIRLALLEFFQNMKLFFFVGWATMPGGAAPVEVELNRWGGTAVETASWDWSSCIVGSSGVSFTSPFELVLEVRRNQVEIFLLGPMEEPLLLDLDLPFMAGSSGRSGMWL